MELHPLNQRLKRIRNGLYNNPVCIVNFFKHNINTIYRICNIKEYWWKR